MGKYCPGCGAEIIANAKFCQKCGAQIQTKTNSNTFESQVAKTPTQQAPPVQPPPTTPVPPPQQQFGQTQSYTPMQPKKLNTKMIGIIIAVVVAVVVIGIIFYIFIGGGADGRFVGQWEQSGSSSYVSVTWDFQSDGDLLIITETPYTGTNAVTSSWNVKGNQVCTPYCYDYQFSGSTLTLSDPAGGVDIILYKK